MKPLPPYNPAASCPKCGGTDIGVRHEVGVHGHDCPLDGLGWMGRECCTFEHLCRGCRRCGYAWAERPLGAAE